MMEMNYPPKGTYISLTPMTAMTQPMTPMTPMSPMAPMTPLPHEFDFNGRPKKERNTPPPSHQEQRRRNHRAMPSVIENLAFHKLWQEKQHTGEDRMQRQNTW